MLAAFAAYHPSIRAGEPVRLALASPITTSSAATNTIKITAKTFVADTNSLLFSVSPRASKSNLPTKTILSPNTDLQSAAPIMVVVRKSPESAGLFSNQSGVGSFGVAGIEAGYGQAYDCDSIVLRGRNGTAWEETRYLFFKKVIKF